MPIGGPSAHNPSYIVGRFLEEDEISSKENMKLFLDRKKPHWLPDILGESVAMLPQYSNEKTSGQDGYDWFGVHWTWDKDAGAPYPTAGGNPLKDITKWKTEVEFPNLDSMDWETDVEAQRKRIDSRRMTMHRSNEGPFERLRSLLGFENALEMLVVEPEACYDLLSAIADHKIRLYKKICQYYGPLDMIIHPDDYGTQRSGFFSDSMFKELIYPHDKKIGEFIKGEGMYFGLHSCGNNERYIHQIIDMGVDLWDAQSSSNDVIAIHEKYGGQLSMLLYSDLSFVTYPEITEAEAFEKIHAFVDKYAPYHRFTSIPMAEDTDLTLACSREFYRYSKVKLGSMA